MDDAGGGLGAAYPGSRGGATDPGGIGRKRRQPVTAERHWAKRCSSTFRPRPQSLGSGGFAASFTNRGKPPASTVVMAPATVAVPTYGCAEPPHVSVSIGSQPVGAADSRTK